MANQKTKISVFKLKILTSVKQSQIINLMISDTKKYNNKLKIGEAQGYQQYFEEFLQYISPTSLTKVVNHSAGRQLGIDGLFSYLKVILAMLCGITLNQPLNREKNNNLGQKNESKFNGI